MTGEPRRDPDPPPDIEIAAGAHARTIRFDEEPETRVQHHGDYDAETVTERENLPDEVEAGVTYRDVKVRWQTSVRVKDD